jgi:hypothetical protein
MNTIFTKFWHTLLYLLLGIVFLPLYFCAFLIDKVLGLELEEKI